MKTSKMEVLILLLGLAGVILNINKSVWGFVVWIPTNITMMMINRKRPALAALFAVYVLSCIWGIYRWN